MSYLTWCPVAGCEEQVPGIYCDAHKVALPQGPAFAAGERVVFAYRGTQKAGIVESVARTKAVVLIDVLGGTKQKLVRVSMDALTKESL